jgi:hypothetical protein
VVCINARPGNGYVPAGETLPEEGMIHTVREIVPGSTHGLDEDCLFLVEIINQPRRYGAPAVGSVVFEMYFRGSRFRPLPSTNIEVFLEMLEPADASAPAQCTLEPISN